MGYYWFFTRYSSFFTREVIFLKRICNPFEIYCWNYVTSNILQVDNNVFFPSLIISFLALQKFWFLMWTIDFFLRLQNAHKLHRYFSILHIHIWQILKQFDHSVFSGYSNLTNSIVSVYMQSISSSHLGSIIEVTQATEQCKMSPLGILVFLKSIPNLILPRTKSSQHNLSF